MNFIFALLLSLISLFLILLVLVQRGRGGGLTGALGGMGGQSAFGTKAGDTFTRVTIIAATVWIVTSIIAVKFLGGKGGLLGDADAALPPAPPTSTAGPGGALPSNPLGDLPGTADPGESTSGDTATSGGAESPSAESTPDDASTE